MAFAQEAKFDTLTVTATREERASSEVPQAIAVIGKEAMEQKKMFNVKEALQEIPGVLIDSKNGGFDARLIIRGAGLKAPYGIREIMVLRDDVARFEDNNNQISKYDYATGKYVAGAGQTTLKKTFDLPAPKIAASYKLDNSFHVFAMAAQAGQIPSTNEISSNPVLEAPIARNYEVGLKGRGRFAATFRKLLRCRCSHDRCSLETADPPISAQSQRCVAACDEERFI